MLYEVITSGSGLCRTWDKLTDGNCMYTKNNASIKMVGDETTSDNADYILVVNSACDQKRKQTWYPSLNELSRSIFMKMEPCFMDPFWRDVDKRLLVITSYSIHYTKLYDFVR